MPPCVFSTHAHKLWFLQDKSASISLSLSPRGSWRRESLLRILALLHHNTHDVSTFHTHFSPTTLATFWTCMDTKLAHRGAHKVGTRAPCKCSKKSSFPPPKACSRLALQSPSSVCAPPPDLKIAGNSIFILLSKNFFLSYTAPLPNFRTSRGVPAPSSPAFWAAAEVEKQCGP